MNVGDRVVIHPATDLWMRGVRYATVVKIGRKWVHVQSGMTTKHKLPAHLLEVVTDRTGPGDKRHFLR